MNATRRRVGTDEEPQSPQVPASQIATGLHDHSFTLQAIMELQKSSAEISTNLQTLKSSVDGVKSKVEDLVGWKNKIVGGAHVGTSQHLLPNAGNGFFQRALGRRRRRQHDGGLRLR